MRLSSCSSCDAFVPPTATSCPHCAAPHASTAKAKRPLRGLMAIGAGGLLSMTLSACYGAVVDPYDSGPFPYDSGSDDSGMVLDSGGPTPTDAGSDAGGADDAGADDAGADDAGADDAGADDAGADAGDDAGA